MFTRVIRHRTWFKVRIYNPRAELKSEKNQTKLPIHCSVFIRRTLNSVSITVFWGVFRVFSKVLAWVGSLKFRVGFMIRCSPVFFKYSTSTTQYDGAYSPDMAFRKSRTSTGSQTLKVTSLSHFSNLLKVVRGSTELKIDRTVLPINTSAGVFPFSIGWMLILISSSVPLSPFQHVHKFIGLAIRLWMVRRRSGVFNCTVLQYSLRQLEVNCVKFSNWPWVGKM